MTKHELTKRIENFIEEVENTDSWESKDFTETALCYLEKALEFLKEDHIIKESYMTNDSNKKIKIFENNEDIN